MWVDCNDKTFRVTQSNECPGVSPRSDESLITRAVESREPAWDTGEQTSRVEPGTRAGAVRGEKTQVQTWVWHSLWLHRQCRQSAGSELCTESLQHSAQDIAGVRWAAVRAGYWIWSEQLSDQLTAAEISIRLYRDLLLF